MTAIRPAGVILFFQELVTESKISMLQLQQTNCGGRASAYRKQSASAGQHHLADVMDK